MEQGERHSVKSADRVLDLFEALARWGRPMSHTDLAAELKIPKSSLTQLLHTLVSRGYLVFVAEQRSYALGPALLTLAKEKAAGRSLVELARDSLKQVTEGCRESSALYMLHGDEAVIAAAVLGPQRLLMHMKEGDVAPLYATSGGKVLLAFLPEPLREDYLQRVQLQRILPNTIHSVSRLRKEIQRVRTEELASVDEEFTEGIVGISVPIRRRSSFSDAPALGALNVAMPKARDNALQRARVVELLRLAAGQLERALA